MSKSQSQPHPTPEVAVVVTTHNRPDYLPQTLDSVKAQETSARFEVVVVDDGSTDNTKAVVEPYLGESSRSHGWSSLRYVFQENQGLAEARNTGIARTTAPLIAFVDDDDLWEPGKIEAQLQLMGADPEVGLAHTAFRYIDQDGNYLDHGPQRVDNRCRGWCLDVLLNELMVVASTVMVRRQTILAAAAAEPHGKPYDPKWVRSQDYDFALRIARVSKFAYVEQSMLRYRLHSGNIALSENNIKRAFGYHCRVQMDFVRRWGQEISVDEQDVKERVAKFVFERAESHFWQRKLHIAKQLCDLAQELDVYNDRFEDLRRRADRPAWMYRIKDSVDRLRRVK